VRLELVGHAGADVRVREEDECRRQRVSRVREDRVVEIVQRYDETDVVLAYQLHESGDVLGIRDLRHDGLPVGVVERRREGIGVGAERDRSSAAKRPHDVDALARAGEQDDHERREYSEDFAATPLT